MRTLATFAALPVLVSILAGPLAGDEVRLTLKYKEGETLRYRMTQEMNQTIAGPTEMETTSVIAQVLKQKVKSIDAEGVATLECGWEAIKIHMSNPMGGDIDFDSTKGDSPESVPESVRGLAGIVGVSFTLEMKPTGEVVAMKGMAEALEKLFGGAAASSNPAKAMLSQMFTEESMKRMFELSILPEKPIAIGTTWTHDVEIPAGPIGKMKVHGAFELVGKEETRGIACAKLGLKQEITMSDSKPDFSAIPGGDRFDISFAIDEAKGGGSLYYALDPGRLVQSDIETHMEMSMKLKPKGEDAGDIPAIEITIGMDMDQKMVLLGADEPAFEPEKKEEKK